jgi:hypothetical protein
MARFVVVCDGNQDTGVDQYGHRLDSGTLCQLPASQASPSGSNIERLALT